MAEDQDPLRMYNFGLLVEGLEVGRFIACSGLGADIDVIAYREGGARMEIRHLPGQTRYLPMTLRFGLSKSGLLWNWFQEAASGMPARRNASLIMFDNDGSAEAFRWNLFDAWVSNWRAARLDANSSDVAVDAMTMVYDRMERD